MELEEDAVGVLDTLDEDDDEDEDEDEGARTGYEFEADYVFQEQQVNQVEGCKFAVEDYDAEIIAMIEQMEQKGMMEDYELMEINNNQSGFVKEFEELMELEELRELVELEEQMEHNGK
ncbi:MAG: hypothetical protein EZS28_015386 [Streblomastix strix]|uniref:Uncharacterized protein n=1 Tax=Streblomastix strix TaxID=222440 RepID=A0A5J4W2F4_9EUKA|nr:MAG: hypothetical protein EZS28_015386 [Streblomastix strix]